MSPADLIARLMTGGDPLQAMAADALAASGAEADRLRERIAQLEAVARLNLETILAMQIAAAEAARQQYRTSSRSGARTARNSPDA